MTTKTPQYILDKKKEQYASLSEKEKEKKKEGWREYYAYNLDKKLEQYKEKYAETIICECGKEVHIPYLNKHKKTLKHQRIINQEKRNKKFMDSIGHESIH